ncbi:sodium/hydrogen exchanger 10 [Plakobranchus ocellatus]|uniref:Sodium/hydrogen exchanger 10 n=1 Tax=Plakobranchus ocellatus TaxID=259542 RepID=A0AAV3YZW8_9GAST|nr:sodium/hydrogen exchanger 10 [Plakobranchus ocellatus]
MQMENQQRPLMLAIPSIEESDLHVSTYDPQHDEYRVTESESQCTFTSGSSNNPPSWQPRRSHHKKESFTAGIVVSEEPTKSFTHESKEIEQQQKHAPQTMYRNIEEITGKRTFLSTGCNKSNEW